jgi:hypothetical protein
MASSWQVRAKSAETYSVWANGEYSESFYVSYNRQDIMEHWNTEDSSNTVAITTYANGSLWGAVNVNVTNGENYAFKHYTYRFGGKRRTGHIELNAEACESKINNCLTFTIQNINNFTSEIDFGRQFKKCNAVSLISKNQIV